MSVELVGMGSANRVVFTELPALIAPGTLGQTGINEVDPSYLCLISRVDGQLLLWELGGKGGTSVNGSRVTHAALRDCDTLGLCGTEFRVHIEPPRRRYLYGVRN